MSDELKQAALSYAARGWAVFPLAPNGKLPLIAKERGGRGVHDATTDPKQIATWWDQTPEANIGIAAGASGLLLVDVDAKDGRDGFTSWEVQRVTHLVDDTTPHVWTPHDGKHLYFLAPTGVELRNTNDELGPGVETKANGTYLVAPPSRLPDGTYRWDERLNLDTVPLATFPPSLAAQIAKQPRVERKAERRPLTRTFPGDEDDIIGDALSHLDPWDGNYNWWVSILMSIHSKFPGPDGLQMAEEWAAGKDGEVAEKWKGFKQDGGITLGTLFDEAERHGWIAPWHQSPTAQTHPNKDEPPGWLSDDGQDLSYDPPITTKKAKIALPRANAVPRVTGWSAAELLATEFPEPQWAVPGLIPVGLTFLAGRPKVGKSWLALQTAIAVGTGGVVLDKRVEQGKVLYLALEDNGRRLQERTKKQGMLSSAAIRFETTWPRLTDNGLLSLDAAISEHKYTLVVIDTLGRLLGRADQQDLADMTEIVGGLQDIAMRNDMAVLVLDHHRKPSGFSTDPIDDIVGSTAKSAVTDAALGLSKEQGKRGATLKVTGRDVEWQDLALSWDIATCCWQYEGTTEEVQMQGRKGDVLDALRGSEGPMTLTELVKVTGMDKGNLLHVVNDLVTEGVVERLPKQGRDVPYRIKGV